MVSVAPQLIRLKAYRSVYGIVAKYIRDPHLRQLFSFHSLLVGGNPFTTTSIYTLIHCLERKWGVYFPKGGTGALVQAAAARNAVPVTLELGGKSPQIVFADADLDRALPFLVIISAMLLTGRSGEDPTAMAYITKAAFWNRSRPKV